MKPSAYSNEYQKRVLRSVVMVFATAILSTLTGERGSVNAAEQKAAADSSGFLQDRIDLARDKVFPALVNIQLVTAQYYGGKELRRRVVGSGTIISDDGYVLTNQHVTSNGRRFRCTLADKREISARLVGEDPLTDLAVLQLNMNEFEESAGSITVAKLGDSSSLRIGDHVLAMGSPFALSRSVTLGVVSNTERVFAGGIGGGDPGDMRLERGQRTGLFTRWIQHDALIHPGNSGGPLVNLDGEIVGVNELGGSSMGFAIPSNLSRQVADAIIADGEVKRSWIGVSFRSLDKTGLKEGVLVNSVVEDSPADKSGLKPGDVVLQIDDQPITVRFVEEIPLLLKSIADRPIGSALKVSYRRDEEIHEAQIVTNPLEKDRGDEKEFRSWGVTAMEITPFCCREHRLTDMEGVLVTGVRQGGAASLAKPPLGYNDVIRKVDESKIANLEVFVDEYERIMDMNPLPEFVMIEFERQGKNHVTLIKPKPDDDRDPPPELAKAWIGVAVQPVLDDLAERLGGKNAKGFRITQVYPRTNAAQTDLKVGDIITHLNGKRINPNRAEDFGRFHRAVKKLDMDDSAELSLIRDGEEINLSLPLERTRLKPEEARRDHNRDFELQVRDTTFFDRVVNRWDEQTKGVIATSVESAGWAGLGGVRPRDLVQQIDDQIVTDIISYRDAIEAVTQKKPDRVVFYILRGVRTRFVYVEPEWGPATDDDKEAQ